MTVAVMAQTVPRHITSALHLDSRSRRRPHPIMIYSTAQAT